MRGLGFLAATLALLAAPAAAVDRSKFRTCQDAAFCRRHREKTSEPEFRFLPSTLKTDGGVASATLSSAAAGAPPFTFSVQAYTTGVARLRITEKNELPARWESPDIVQEGELVSTAVSALSPSDGAIAALTGAPAVEGTSYLLYTAGTGPAGSASPRRHLLSVRHFPFRVELWQEGSGAASGVPLVVVNDRGTSYFEHRRSKDGGSVAGAAGGAEGSGEAVKTEKKIVDWGEDGKPIYEDGTHGDAVDTAHTSSEPAASPDEAGLWGENFGTHHDSKPFGPTSVGLDVVFPAATHAYGIPEHASSHALKATDGSEDGSYTSPYRLYNLDVFEYELDNSMALYGSIPFLLAHGPAATPSSSTGGGVTVGIYWNNPTETYVDIAKGLRGSTEQGVKRGVGSRWVSESGVWDLFITPGPSGKAAIGQFTSVVGTQALPPLFALGYHQCRWNYKDEADVFAVDAKFEEHAFPYDVLWLDIEHTDGKRYFTWDKHLFPNPVAMQDRLASRGHKMVTIIDPHIKRDGGYRIHSEASSKGLYVKNKDGGEYDGWCWPGSSSYLDFTSPATRDWWADQFKLENYAGSTLSLYTWNDMNEPSVFNGPEVSMNKDALSLSGVEHREWHNLYGFYQTMATAEGQLRRTPDRNSRPFLLTRAFYAGTQRYGAIWTGDNAAKWEHLSIASPMLLTIGVSGLTFAGADVGGFFNNPSTELMIRWYQAGSWQPFFRAHAHIDTARREPWLFGDDVLTALRDTVRTRYTYLPYWYTLFAAANATGIPAMRPLWLEYPGDAATYAMDDQWLAGGDMLIKPVTAAGGASAEVYFPGSGPWYDAATLALAVPAGAGPARKTVAAPLTTIPVYQRGGSIVPRQMRPRRSSALMAADPYTLQIALDAAGSASGELYLDDGSTFDFRRKGAFRLRKFSYTSTAAAGGRTSAVLSSTLAAGGKSYAPENVVERIVIAGLSRAPSSVTAVDGAASVAAGSGTASSGRALTFEWDAASSVLTVRRPEVKVAYDFSIALEW